MGSLLKCLNAAIKVLGSMLPLQSDSCIWLLCVCLIGARGNCLAYLQYYSTLSYLEWEKYEKPLQLTHRTDLFEFHGGCQTPKLHEGPGRTTPLREFEVSDETCGRPIHSNPECNNNIMARLSICSNGLEIVHSGACARDVSANVHLHGRRTG